MVKQHHRVERTHGGHEQAFNDSRPEANMITASQLTGALPTGQYSWRPPSPPSIHVPQTTESEELVLPKYSAVGYTGEENEILRAITGEDRAVLGAKEWKYEWRRQAQSILTFLYLGPSAASRDIANLRKEGITLLLVIRSTMSAQASLLSGEKAARELGIESAAVDVGSHTELIAAFPRACKIINDHLITKFRQNPSLNSASTPPGKVLVFCESGNERSAAVVAAYLMNMYGINLIGAMQYIQSQRFCVAFDDGLKFLLRNYQDILDAQRSVAVTTVAQGSALKGKRVRAEVEEDDMDLDPERGDDEARFSGRAGFMPFHQT